MVDRIRIIPHFPEGIPDCGSFEVWFADGRHSQYISTGTIIPVEPRPGRWIRIKRGKPRALWHALNATNWTKLAHCVTAAAGFAKPIPTSLGKVRTPAPEARLGAPCLHPSTSDKPPRLTKGFDPDQGKR
jgi:hypothetical protein